MVFEISRADFAFCNSKTIACAKKFKRFRHPPEVVFLKKKRFLDLDFLKMSP